LVDRSLSDPIRWRPRADPGQKRETDDRIRLMHLLEVAGTSDIARLLPGWCGMVPPSTTLCAGCASGLAAIVDRGTIPHGMKLQAGTRKRRASRTRKLKDRKLKERRIYRDKSLERD
jgi:hypothetical protein